ncbi:MAG: hypothetical protein B9S32_07705 [Verrucomicrobia bacterium Tous-C9LFEB]|nr:MAG: hypothetical protein B9S32_07705 [Verrucomicrobia bacterium Tous-C9LFEB]
MTPRFSPTTTANAQADLENKNRPHPTDSTPETIGTPANVRFVPNQPAYRWNADELGDSPLRKCVAVLPLVF